MGTIRSYTRKRVSPPDWSAAGRLITAARPHLIEEAHELLCLLKESFDKFGMNDPLLNDLGMHRWIDKETSYSDWLAWVLERLEPSAVLEVLNVKPRFKPRQAGKCQVQRESQLDKRFIDLVIRFDGVPGYAIGVEIKTDDKQYAKQEYYLKSLRTRYGKNMRCIIITRHPIHKDCRYGFTPRPWREVALALRKNIVEYAQKNNDNHIITAMMLGFVAAVEQNLLEFSTVAPHRVSKGELTLIPKDLVTYLRGEEQ
jgi:hypothetical protein